MKNTVIYVLFVITPLFTQAQQLFRLQLDSYQKIETTSGTMGKEINLPDRNATILLGGLNDLDGIGNYLNIYGSKLIIDSLNMGSDGTKHVVLRREDGLDFFNLFPTITATLIPMHYHENENREHLRTNSP